MSEVVTYPTHGDIVALSEDPTGGRLVAWAQAASAAHALATSLSKTAFVPESMRDVGNATAALLMGDELGLRPLAALRSIYVVHGTPALFARTMVALALSHGHLIWTEETSDTKVVVCGQRRGSEHVERSEWTIQRATKAGYTSVNKKYAATPQEMLYAKAAGEVARKVAADVLAGVPYSVEDLELEPANEPTTTITRESATRRTVQRAPRPAPHEPAEPPLTVETPEPPKADPITPQQMKKLHILLNKAGGGEREAGLAILSTLTGRTVESSKTLTKDEASKVIDALDDDSPATATPAEPPVDDADYPFPAEEPAP